MQNFKENGAYAPPELQKALKKRDALKLVIEEMFQDSEYTVSLFVTRKDGKYMFEYLPDMPPLHNSGFHHHVALTDQV